MKTALRRQLERSYDDRVKLYFPGLRSEGHPRFALERKSSDGREYQIIVVRGIPPFRKERGRMGHPRFVAESRPGHPAPGTRFCGMGGKLMEFRIIIFPKML